MSDEREERIRTHAYRLWEEQGRPEGRHDEHWRDAAATVDGAVDPAMPTEPTDSPAPDEPMVSTDVEGAASGGTGDAASPAPTESPAETVTPPAAASGSKAMTAKTSRARRART